MRLPQIVQNHPNNYKKNIGFSKVDLNIKYSTVIRRMF